MHFLTFCGGNLNNKLQKRDAPWKLELSFEKKQGYCNQ